jgi:raffinose/stachyose/melibiose transport system permease protein
MLVIFGSLAGFGITYAKNKTLNAVYLIYIALISLPLQIAMVPLIVLMRKLGLTDTHLGMALIYSAVYLPFVVFLYTGFMRGIPRDLIEAAKIDGCNPFTMYVKIFMPLLTTITGVVVILRGVSTWNDLFVPLIVVNKAGMYTLPMKLYFFATSRQGQWHIVFGATFLCMIPIIVLFLAMQKTFIKGIMAGSIKG